MRDDIYNTSKALAPKTGATHYHANLRLSDKGRAIKWLVFCNSLDLEPMDQGYS